MGELFADFEVNKSPRWRKLLRLSSASFVLHGLFLAAIIYVPVLNEIFHIKDKASDLKFVEEGYQRTTIRDRAVMIDVRHFTYPPGYFNMNPTQTEAPAPQVIERAKPKPAPTPKPIPTPSPTPSPSPEAAAQASEVAAKEQPKTKAEAEKAIDDVAAKNGVVRPDENKINKKPLKDWLARSNELYKQGHLDLSKTIELVIIAQRDDKGKLHDPHVVSKAGDPNLIEAAKELVAAVSDSNILYILNDSGGGQVRFVVKLDATQVTATVESEVESEARAQTLARSYGLMSIIGAYARSDKDEGTILKNTHISHKGNQIVVNFSMPRQTAGEMLKKQLPAS